MNQTVRSRCSVPTKPFELTAQAPRVDPRNSWKELLQLKIVSEGAICVRFRVLSDCLDEGGIILESVVAKVDIAIPSSDVQVPR
jgi:hypothetical protein